GSWQHAGREPPASPSSRGPIPPLRHGRCRGGGRRREPFDDEDLAVEIDDVEVADLVDTEADDAVVATGVGSEVGIAYGELRARYRRPLRHLRDRERPDIRRAEIGEHVLSLQLLDGAAIDVTADDGGALARAGAARVLGDGRGQA